MLLQSNVKDMTIEQIMEEMVDILDWFDNQSTGDPYGWDWPTMAAIFPETALRYQQLRAEGRKRKGLPTNSY